MDNPEKPTTYQNMRGTPLHANKHKWCK